METLKRIRGFCLEDIGKINKNVRGRQGVRGTMADGAEIVFCFGFSLLVIRSACKRVYAIFSTDRAGVKKTSESMRDTTIYELLKNVKTTFFFLQIFIAIENHTAYGRGVYMIICVLNEFPATFREIPIQ